MIYTRFGSAITLLSKRLEGNGRLSIQGTSRGPADIREYDAGDLEADGGFAEIDQAIASLPLESDAQKVKRVHKVPSEATRGEQHPAWPREGDEGRPGDSHQSPPTHGRRVVVFKKSGRSAAADDLSPRRPL